MVGQSGENYIMRKGLGSVMRSMYRMVFFLCYFFFSIPRDEEKKGMFRAVIGRLFLVSSHSICPTGPLKGTGANVSSRDKRCRDP